jgi:hypothetical protein
MCWYQITIYDLTFICPIDGACHGGENMKFKKSNVTLLINEKHIGIDIAFQWTNGSCNSYGKDGAKNMDFFFNLVTWSTISPKTTLQPFKHSTNKQFHKNGLEKMYLWTQIHKFIMDIITKHFF